MRAVGFGLTLLGAAGMALLAACSGGSSSSGPAGSSASATAEATGSGTPASSGAKLLQALAVGVSRTGVVYIADYGNQSIDRVDVDPATKSRTVKVVTTLKPPSSGAESGPESLVVDSAGNVIFAENGNRRVQKLQPDGRVTRLAGTGQIGRPVEGGTAASSKIYLPLGVAVDGRGDIFVADNGYSMVDEITTDGKIHIVAGGAGVGQSGDGGPATRAQITAPDGVAVDAKGDVFISSQYQIREVTPDGIIHAFAGTGTKGVIGDGGRATEAELTGPSGLAVGPDGSLYIADYTAEVVRKVDAHGIISTVAGNGRDGSSGDGGKATEAELDHPADIALTPSGELLIATRTSIRDVGLNGIISTYVG